MCVRFRPLSFVLSDAMSQRSMRLRAISHHHARFCGRVNRRCRKPPTPPNTPRALSVFRLLKFVLSDALSQRSMRLRANGHHHTAPRRAAASKCGPSYRPPFPHTVLRLLSFVLSDAMSQRSMRLRAISHQRTSGLALATPGLNTILIKRPPPVPDPIPSKRTSQTGPPCPCPCPSSCPCTHRPGYLKSTSMSCISGGGSSVGSGKWNSTV